MAAKRRKAPALSLIHISSEFYKDGVYDYTKFEGEKGAKRSSKEQVEYLKGLVAKYPIDSIEDGMSENDWDCLLYTSPRRCGGV